MCIRDRYISVEETRQNNFEINWDSYNFPKPTFIGNKTFKDIPLTELKPFIDWTPFFSSWQLAGKYPAILKDEVVGKEATSLFNDGQKMLDRIISEKWLSANAVIGLYPANAIEGDTTEIYSDESRKEVKEKLFHLRQQRKKASGKPNMSCLLYTSPSPRDRG